MSKLRDGPGKVRHAPPSGFPREGARRRMYNSRTEGDPRTCATDVEAETHVRGADQPARAADIQYGIRLTRDGESEEHDGDRGRDEAGEQGAEKAIRKD